jgi:hypothetical protein
MSLRLKVAVLHYQPATDPMDPVVTHICDALTELGHTPVTIAVHDRVFPVLQAIEDAQATSSSTSARPSPTTTAWR